MFEDWQYRQVARLESELTSLRSDIWDLEADVRRRFWEQDRAHWERGNRQLRFVGWLIVALAWITPGAVIAITVLKG
jgi:hypothetical protein